MHDQEEVTRISFLSCPTRHSKIEIFALVEVKNKAVFRKTINTFLSDATIKSLLYSYLDLENRMIFINAEKFFSEQLTES